MWNETMNSGELDPLIVREIEEASDWNAALARYQNALLIFNRAGTVTHYNEGLITLLGQEPDEKAPLLSLWHPDYRSLAVLSKVQTAIDAGDIWHGMVYNRRPNGSLYWASVTVWPINSGTGEAASHFLFTVNAASNHALNQALFDHLTQLPNRGLGSDVLEKLLWHAHQDRMVTVLQVRLPGLQEINDVLGYTAVDSILIEAARRLSVSEVAPDVIARTGNHDFLLVLLDTDREAGTARAARQILSALDQTYELSNQEVTVTAKVSATTAPTDGLSSDVLLQNCGIAMATSRASSANISIFTPEMQRRAAMRGDLSSKLRRALQEDELSLHYQPQVSAFSGQMVGCEALLRWTHPQLGVISPDRFIRLAEENALIVPLSHWVFNRACSQGVTWLKQGRNIGRISINASPLHFQQGNLFEDVKRALEETGLPPENLEIEITESALMAESPEVIDALKKLVDMGVTLSLDDFGTGYSSLTYLQRYPFQTLKIDRSFVFGLTTNTSSQVLIRTIITMAKHLQLKVIAEGVETLEQDRFLRGEGCDVIQGYHYSKPLHADQFGSLLTHNQPFYPAFAKAVG